MVGTPGEKNVVLAEDPELLTKFRKWMEWDQNETTRQQIQEMAELGQLDDLRKHLLKRLQFGTAGLRGRMGPGNNCMNDLVIIQTSQGLASYVMKTCGNGNQLGAVVCYDGRHNSRRFAELTTVAFLNQGFKVYLSSQLCPTPFVPFAVKYLKCNVGVMVTASHNPKEDNGYKIISPTDKEIQNSIMENLEPVATAWNTNLVSSKDVEDPLPTIEPVYYNILAEVAGHIKSRHKSTKLRFTYTPMHGVGHRYVQDALKSAGIDMEELLVVPEQRDADPDFPTVKFPNPEEGKSALNLAMKLADENNSPIILANDPDADRLAVAEKLPSGEWKIFNGNELGALIGWWCWVSYMERPDHLDPSDCYMIASTVSSKFLKTMAEAHGFNFIETLTGFKWMGNIADELIADGKAVLFAFEEAIGFMVGTAVLDKDGVSAAAFVAQMATILYEQGLTLNQQLQRLYDKYGYHVSHNSYYICYEPSIITKVFENIRNFHPNNGLVGYPSGLMNNKYKVTAVRDLTTGYDSEQLDQKATLPVSKSSQMITFKLDSGLVLTLRTSGTEPKIKYYSELRATPGNNDRRAIERNLNEMINAMINEWLLPEKWGLIQRSDD
ncbi:Phosphoglucomutase-2 [Orchesella cincta]|uniref:Phosphoglucomutase-2 n=1 Tax=Orchesella cincta TaxID=48709 RepID=A0A1D2NCZ4_ORCCI|nr:Phosphoglucomutase-2 [Orchesella cincta]